jgi:hypothetical protein
LQYSHAVRIGCRDDIAGQQHVSRGRNANGFDEPRHAAPSRAVAESRFRETNPTCCGANTDIAGERQLQTAAKRPALQRRDHRRRKVGNSLEGPIPQG